MYGDSMKRAWFYLLAETVGLIVACIGVFMVHTSLGLIATGVAIVAMVEARA
jgi:uncharacterized membrane protein YgaE (UPF0421/DUF939 family)